MKKLAGNPWAMLVVLSFGFFMTMLDVTIVNVSIPSIIAGLHTSLDQVAWVINAYVIAVAVLLITAGRLGDLYGPKRLFVLGVGVFTLASVACGAAASAEELIAARLVQGLGAALLLPQTMAIIIATFPPERRGAALGIWGSVGGLATLTGPMLGGLLVTLASWRWVFFINAPVGVLVIIAAWRLIPELKLGRNSSLDIPGVLLSWSGLVLLTFGLMQGQRYHWGTIAGVVSIPRVLAAGVVLLALFLWHQARKQDRQPLIPYSLFRDRNYALMNGANVLVAVAMMTTFLPLAIYQQSVLHYSALKAGLVMTPISLVSTLLAPFSGRFVDKMGGKYILLIGLLLFAVGMALVSRASGTETSWYAFEPGLVIAGVGLGCTFGPMQSIATHNVPPRQAGAASGVLNSNRQLGSVFGGPIAVATLEYVLQTQVATRTAAASAALPPELRGAFAATLGRAAMVGLKPGAAQLESGLTRGLSHVQASEVARGAEQAFAESFVVALQATLAIGIAASVIGAVLCLALRPSARALAHAAARPEPVPAGLDQRTSA